MAFITSPLTMRFIECVKELRARGIVKTDKTIATTLNYPTSNLSSVLNGKLNIPYKFAFIFATKYRISNFFEYQFKPLVMPEITKANTITSLYQKLPAPTSICNLNIDEEHAISFSWRTIPLRVSWTTGSYSVEEVTGRLLASTPLSMLVAHILNRP